MNNLLFFRCRSVNSHDYSVMQFAGVAVLYVRYLVVSRLVRHRYPVRVRSGVNKIVSHLAFLSESRF
jgi:hypothetical protein